MFEVVTKSTAGDPNGESFNTPQSDEPPTASEELQLAQIKLEIDKVELKRDELEVERIELLEQGRLDFAKESSMRDFVSKAIIVAYILAAGVAAGYVVDKFDTKTLDVQFAVLATAALTVNVAGGVLIVILRNRIKELQERNDWLVKRFDFAKPEHETRALGVGD